jgi:hypothetical protein
LIDAVTAEGVLRALVVPRRKSHALGGKVQIPELVNGAGEHDAAARLQAGLVLTVIVGRHTLGVQGVVDEMILHALIDRAMIVVVATVATLAARARIERKPTVAGPDSLTAHILRRADRA